MMGGNRIKSVGGGIGIIMGSNSKDRCFRQYSLIQAISDMFFRNSFLTLTSMAKVFQRLASRGYHTTTVVHHDLGA